MIPGTGELTTVDPDLAETGQPYDYAGDDPVDESDASGDSPGGGGGLWYPGYPGYPTSPYSYSDQYTVYRVYILKYDGLPFYDGITSQLSVINGPAGNQLGTLVQSRLNQHIAAGRFGRLVPFEADVLDGEIQGTFQARGVEQIVSDLLGTRVGWPGNVSQPMSEDLFSQLGKESGMAWLREHPGAGNQLGSLMRDVADGVDRAPLAQSEQVLNAEDAILAGELELPGYWGVGGERPPLEEAPEETTSVPCS